MPQPSTILANEIQDLEVPLSKDEEELLALLSDIIVELSIRDVYEKRNTLSTLQLSRPE
jgi:hypothetical protein